MLNIVNTNKVIGKTFVDGRFVCTYVQDSITQWRFQFEDLQSDSKRFLWIELHKVGRWDDEDKRVYYTLGYYKAPLHRVSLDFFSELENVLSTFEDALNTSIK